MPLSERLRINAGRSFAHSLIVRVFVVLVLFAIIAGLNLSKNYSMKHAQTENVTKVYSVVDWENNDKNKTSGDKYLNIY